MKKLNLEKKIDKDGFLLVCDTKYFNSWAKMLFLSIKTHSSWAHIHFHLFDPTVEDMTWLSKNNCTFSTEVTPEPYSKDKFQSVLYWSAARYIRVPEIYEDSVRVIDLDVDSVMVKELPRSVFINDLKTSWVPVRIKGGKVKSLASAIGFGSDNIRHTYAGYLKDKYDKNELVWALDQSILNDMIAKNEITQMSLKYTDYKFGTKLESYIWTAKGDRVNSEKFVDELNKYKSAVS